MDRSPAPRGAILLVVALVALPPLVGAHVGDNRPHVQFQENRLVTASVDGDRVTYHFELVPDRTADPIWVRFDGRTGVLEYEHRREEARVDSSYKFRLVLDEVVEYRDRNDNLEYDPGVDDSVRAYPVRSMRWNVSEPEIKMLRGVELTYVEARGYFGPAGPREGELLIQFLAHGLVFDVALGRMHPQDVKMNWNFARFPFVAEDSRIAFVTRFETPSGLAFTRETDPETNVTKAVLLSSPQRFMFFDWATQTRGNSTGEPPIDRVLGARAASDATPTADGFDSRRIVFSYPRADYLLSHDPTMGFEYAPPESPPVLPWRVVGGLALVGAVIGGGSYSVVYRRRRGRYPPPVEAVASAFRALVEAFRR